MPIPGSPANLAIERLLSIVYLTEELQRGEYLSQADSDSSDTAVWEGSNALRLLPEKTGGDTVPRLLSGTSPETASVLPISGTDDECGDR